MKHEQTGTDFKWTLTFEDPPRSIEVRKVTCSCGWSGDWVAGWKQAAMDFRSHCSGAASLPVSAKVRLRDGTEVKAMVDPAEPAPLSRPKLLETILAASLLMEEAEDRMPPRMRRRSELLRHRMEDAINRENHAQAVIASRPVLPTVEDFTE